MIKERDKTVCHLNSFNVLQNMPSNNYTTEPNGSNQRVVLLV